MSSAVLYSNAVNLANEIHQQILSLNTTNNQQLLQSALNSLSRLDTLIDDLQRLGKSQIQQEKREIIQSRVHQLRLDYSQIKDELEQIKLKRQRERQESERRELMGNTSEIKYRRERNDEQAFLLDVDMREETALENAGNSVDQYIQLGREALGELYQQRSMLKNTQKRLLDIGSRLGLSQSVMRFIEQRSTTDRYILYGLIIGSVILMGLFVHYFG